MATGGRPPQARQRYGLLTVADIVIQRGASDIMAHYVSLEIVYSPTRENYSSYPVS
jgi:hypothetical protein